MSLQLRITRAPDGEVPEAGPRRLPLETILGGRREVIIQHRGEDYRLRLTSNDKLLLTK
ncbi:MAG: hemin uptake protein HemP [Alphaproteobacteria bacterium]|nr:hemin uptake protein HemP [Alphaproteobacteria bacterium]